MTCDWCDGALGQSEWQHEVQLCSTECARNYMLATFQQEVSLWVAENFDPDQPSSYPLMGAAEEIGEIADLYHGSGRVGAVIRMIGATGAVAHSVLKRQQGVREDDPDVGDSAERAAIADLEQAITDFKRSSFEDSPGYAEAIEPSDDLLDGIGDTIVYLADLTDKIDWTETLGHAVQFAWDKEVKHREWDSNVKY